MDSRRRQYSTASIRLLADDMTARLGHSKVDNVLNTLFQIDKQIHDDFNSIKQDLVLARKDADHTRDALRHQISLREKLQSRSDNQNAHIHSLNSQVKKLENALKKNFSDQSQQTKKLTSNYKENKPPTTNTLRTNEILAKGCQCRTDKENNSTRFRRGGHNDDCMLKTILLMEMTHEGLCDLLLAREDAFRNQQTLVSRLKNDNKQLKETYDHLWSRYQLIHSNKSSVTVSEEGLFDDKFQHLSIRVQQAGQIACDAASRVEQRLQETTQTVDKFRQSISVSPRFTTSSVDSIHTAGSTFSHGTVSSLSHNSRGHASNVVKDEYEADDMLSDSVDTFDMQRLSNSHSTEGEACVLAGEELLKTLKIQQEAHDKLRATVFELTKELERISPEKISEARQYRQRMEVAEKELGKLKSQFADKDKAVGDLQKQLNKVVAEYEAVSVMHSYSNAELSKIRANNREKAKLERQPSDRQHALGNAVLDGVENLLHHRKLPFR